MSTRGIYQFTCGNESFCVYKHMDNYPEGPHGGFSAIAKAAARAWPLPRFEADEFAAAFVSANKGETPGNVRVTTPGTWQEAASHDCEYAYIIEGHGEGDFGDVTTVSVTCFDIWHGAAGWSAEEIHKADLAAIIAGWRPERRAA